MEAGEAEVHAEAKEEIPEPPPVADAQAEAAEGDGENPLPEPTESASCEGASAEPDLTANQSKRLALLGKFKVCSFSCSAAGPALADVYTACACAGGAGAQLLRAAGAKAEGV